MGTASTLFPSTTIRNIQVVAIDGVSSGLPVDVRIEHGLVCDIGTSVRAASGDNVIDGAGRWAIPGLWDHHVHSEQWAQSKVRLDLTGTTDATQVTERVRKALAERATGDHSVLVGTGHRSSAWTRQPSVAELNDASGETPVILISGDGHNGWLNSRALRLLGVADRDSPLDEREWFDVFARIGELPDAKGGSDESYREVLGDAAARGIVGIGDMEFGAGYQDWPARFNRGITQVRVRPAVYPDRLDDVLAAGLRSGQVLSDGSELLRMGPLKIISDGSLGNGTASCCEPYADSQSRDFPYGKQNYTQEELVELLSRATAGGLDVALHAIGDAAVTVALNAFEITGAHGSIEHAQLTRRQDLEKMGRLRIRASVQPAHLLDDLEATNLHWPDRADRCFLFKSMLNAGVELAFGSDAPVAPLDPWLSMAAAVHRSTTGRAPWNPIESLSVTEALAASTDGQGTIRVGSRGDIALLDKDPYAAAVDSESAAAHLRNMPVAATILAGRVTHDGL